MSSMVCILLLAYFFYTTFCCVVICGNWNSQDFGIVDYYLKQFPRMTIFGKILTSIWLLSNLPMLLLLLLVVYICAIIPYTIDRVKEKMYR